MTGWPFKARTVARSAAFDAMAPEIEPDVQRFDEIIAGIEWGVATHPEAFPIIPGTQLRIVKTDEVSADTPGLRVFFTIDSADLCTLQAIDKLPLGTGEDS